MDERTRKRKHKGLSRRSLPRAMTLQPLNDFKGHIRQQPWETTPVTHGTGEEQLRLPTAWGPVPA